MGVLASALEVFNCKNWQLATFFAQNYHDMACTELLIFVVSNRQLTPVVMANEDTFCVLISEVNAIDSIYYRRDVAAVPPLQDLYPSL